MYEGESEEAEAQLQESLVAMPDNAYMAPSGWPGPGKE